MSTAIDDLTKKYIAASKAKDWDLVGVLSQQLKIETEKEREAGAARFQEKNGSALRELIKPLSSARSDDELQAAFEAFGNAFSLKCEKKETKKAWYIRNGKVFYEVGDGEDKKSVEIKEVQEKENGKLQVVYSDKCGLLGAPPMVHKVEDEAIRTALEKLPRKRNADK